MAGQSDQATQAVDLDVNGAADQIASLLDDDEQGEQQDGSGDSSQSDDAEQALGEEGADEEGQDKAEGQPAHTYTVKVNGQESQVPLDELIRGYQRGADYTSKTQTLAAQRRDHEAELQAVRHERAQYSQLLKTLDAQLAEANREPNWDMLRQTDPVGYATAWAQYQQRAQQRHALAAEQQRLQQQQLLDEQSRLRDQVELESERLVDAIPSWKDQARATEERKALVEYGLQNGFTADELNSIYDHRAVAILRKAWMYDRAMSKRQQAQQRVEAAPQKVLQPGQGNAARTVRTSDTTRAKQRLAKTGRVEDAAAIFERYL